MKPRCFLAQFSSRPCDGRLVKCHVLPKRMLRQVWREVHHGKLPNEQRVVSHPSQQKLVDDPLVWVWGCGGPMGNGGHHGMLDASRTLRIPRHMLPAEMDELAETLGLSWWLDREYGER